MSIFSAPFEAMYEKSGDFSFLDSITLRVYSGTPEITESGGLHNTVVLAALGKIPEIISKQSCAIRNIKAPLISTERATFFRITLDSDETVYVQGTVGVQLCNDMVCTNLEGELGEIRNLELFITKY